MAAKKRSVKKRKSSARHRRPAQKPITDKEPNYMIQIGEPKLVRKDVLESLREIIIFMQGYEKFRSIQEQKVMLFNSLKTTVKDLNRLIDQQLKAHFPKGKLRAVREEPKPDVEPEPKPVLAVQKEQPTEPVPAAAPSPEPAAAPVPQEKNELDELEAQLKDIEGQLKNIN